MNPHEFSALAGHTKGDVERDIRTYARLIRNAINVTGRVFTDFDDLNTWLDEHMEKTRKPSAKERLVIERKALKPLPPRDRAVLCKVQLTPASPYGIVRVSRSAYSVPDEAIGLSCRVELCGYEARIYRVGGGGGLVARHPRKPDGEDSVLLEHILPSLIRKPGAMVRWAHRNILFPLPGFRKFYSYLQRKPEINAEREFLRAANLVHHASIHDIAAGMELVVETCSEAPLDDLKSIVGLESESNLSLEAASALQPPITLS